MIEAAGGIIFHFHNDIPHVLTIKKRKVWEFPKGKREVNESIEACAYREVCEETGMVPMLIDFLTISEHTYHDDHHGHILKITTWYAMVCAIKKIEIDTINENIEDAKWISVFDLKALLGYDNLRSVSDVFMLWLKKHGVI